MTCAELYTWNHAFRGMIAQWVEQYRCPLEMVDLLLEHDLIDAAECARWAATEVERPMWHKTGDQSGEFDRQLRGPFPGYTDHMGWYWLAWYGDGVRTDECNIVRYHCIKRSVRRSALKSTSAVGALIILLDAWIAVPEEVAT